MVAVLAVSVVACGGDTNDGSETGGTGGSAGSTSGSGGSSGSAGSGGSLTEPENHRPSALACDDERESQPTPGDPSIPGCSADSDCTEGRNGRCTSTREGYECTYDECITDDDCGTDQLCECEGGFWSDANACLSGNCRVDDDCGSGGFCSPSFGTCGNYSGVVGYYCRTAADECLNDSDCVDPEQGPGYCMYEPSVSHWVCGYSHCVG